MCVASPTYAATSTKVNATVCSGNSSNASLVISSPASDSVVTLMPLSITGTIGEITQVDISVDGQYNSTTPVSANQTSFLTSLQLAEGTHTIKLVGNDVCQYSNVTVTLVVTYHPNVSPSLGPVPPAATVTTSTPSSSSNTPASQQAIDNGPEPLSNVPIIGALVPIVKNIGRALDLDATAKQGGIISAMLRFAFFVTGIGLVFFGANIVRFLRKLSLRDRAVKGYVEGGPLQDPGLSKHFHRNISMARYAGVVCLFLSFAI